MGMGAEPEPQGEVTFSAEQKVDNFLKSKTKDHKETSPQGLSGPELQAQVRAAQCPAATPGLAVCNCITCRSAASCCCT